MEYTKDLVFTVQYDEVNKVLSFNKKRRTSRLKEVIKKHKIVTTSIIIVFMLIVLDSVLVLNFIQLLGQV